MIHYLIKKAKNSAYYKIYVRGLFKYYDFNGTYYKTAEDAMDALNNITHGSPAIIHFK